MKLVLLLIAAASLIGCANRVSLPSFGVVPDFVLTDQSGLEFRTSERLNGKLWVANFIFTSCAGPCPRMSGQMRQLTQSAGSADVRFVSFTIDPDRDTPAVLAGYGKRFSADPEHWFFLTGKQKDLHHLKRNVFMLGDVDGSLEHSTRFVLVDRHSRIRGFYDSSDRESIEKLTADLKALTRSSD